MRDFAINITIALGIIAAIMLIALLCGATLQGVAAGLILIAFVFGCFDIVFWLYELVVALRGWIGWLS